MWVLRERMKPQLLGTSRVQEDMEVVGTLERDAQLMLRVREGDETSFALLLERHRAPVIHLLSRLTGNHAVAEELAAAVVLRVF